MKGIVSRSPLSLLPLLIYCIFLFVYLECPTVSQEPPCLPTQKIIKPILLHFPLPVILEFPCHCIESFSSFRMFYYMDKPCLVPTHIRRSSAVIRNRNFPMMSSTSNRWINHSRLLLTSCPTLDS